MMQFWLGILLSETGSHPHLSGVKWLSTSSLFQNRRKGTCIHSQALRAGIGKAWGFRFVYSVCHSELFSTLILSLTQHFCMLCLLHGLFDTWSHLWLLQWWFGSDCFSFFHLPSWSTMCPPFSLQFPHLLFFLSTLFIFLSQDGLKALFHWIPLKNMLGISSMKIRWPLSQKRNKKINLYVHVNFFPAFLSFHNWSLL